jgi:hypothetical protein
MEWDLLNASMAGLGRWDGVVFQVLPSIMEKQFEAIGVDGGK